MKIEEPDWPTLYNNSLAYPDGTLRDPEFFEQWFDMYVRPVNKMLSEGVTMSGSMKTKNKTWTPDIKTGGANSHAGLLINIQPIKKDTAEAVMKDMFDHIQSVYGSSHSDPMDINDLKPYMKRAKAVLKESEEAK